MQGIGVYSAGIKRDRLTELAEFVRVAEGLPPQTPLTQVFDVVAYRKEAQLATERRQAETLVRIVKLATEGGVFLDAVSHLYPDSVIRGIKQRQADQDEERAQMRRLEQIQAIARRFNDAG